MAQESVAPDVCKPTSSKSSSFVDLRDKKNKTNLTVKYKKIDKSLFGPGPEKFSRQPC